MSTPSDPTPPKLPPRELNYITPDPTQKSPNTPGKFFLRMTVGTSLGIVACIGGFLLTAYANLPPALGFVPLGLILVAAIIIAAVFRRLGYVTGVILAPFVLTIGLFMLGLAICGVLILASGK